jgi:hypothetical protein
MAAEKHIAGLREFLKSKPEKERFERFHDDLKNLVGKRMTRETDLRCATKEMLQSPHGEALLLILIK